MLDIRFHGRGGQGTVLAAKMLSDAILRGGKGECMAIPEFGVERRGAPVRAYARISSTKVRVRSKIYDPDIVVLLDPALATSENITEGLKPTGTLLINTDHKREELAKRWPGVRILCIPARAIALAHGLGPAASPVVNTAILGAMCAAFELASLQDVTGAVRDSVPWQVEENIAAAVDAYEMMRKEMGHAKT